MIDLVTISVLLIFAISLVVNCLFVVTKKHHIARSVRSADVLAVQAAHRGPTPRIGGVGIFLGLLTAMAVLMPAEFGTMWWLFAATLVPIFLAGLAEDIGYRVSPSGRLLAAAVSSALCIALLGMWVPRADVPGLDLLFAWAPFALVFTVFAASGICHAFNLIDGMNGLAAGVGVLVSVGLAAIAVEAGETSVATAAIYVVAALLGFLVLNYPLGKIFLGDAGAYTVGHVLAWLSIVLLARIETLSPWAIMLVLFWPLADTVLAIYRRRRSGKPTGQPDRLHFHQLVMRGFEIVHFGRHRRHITNPLATLVILPLAAMPVVAGVVLWDRPLPAFLAFIGFSVLFMASYQLGMKFANTKARRSVRGGAEIMARVSAPVARTGAFGDRRSVKAPASWAPAPEVPRSAIVEQRTPVDVH